MQDDEKYIFTGLSFDGYQLTTKLGEGELGIVYLAVNSKTGEVAACKILKEELSQAGFAVQQFVYEAKTASKLDHGNVIKAINAGHSSGYYYLLMEYVSGISLENIRKNDPGRLTIDFLCDRFCELADALDYAWRNFLLTHGDIKPENILIQTDPCVLKLADLGLAKVAVNTPHHQNIIMGTPLYIAPELASGEESKATVRSDIYSFGVMFYELVCGTAPFTGSVDEVLLSHIEEEPAPVREYNPNVPEKLAQFIHLCMDKSPQNRPEDWASVARFLKNWREIEEKPAAAKSKTKKKLPIWQLIVIVLLALFIIAELVFVIFFI